MPSLPQNERAAGRLRSWLLLLAAAAAAAAQCAGCEADRWSASVPSADIESFREQAYPVLLRDCGFNACHGAPQRFLLIYGPNRARLNPTTHHDVPAEPEEVQVTFERALSMLVADGPVTRSPLLTKPLEERLGGASHGGVDDFNRNVYQSLDDPGYMTLLEWARAATPGTGVPGPLPAGGAAAPSL